MLRIIEILLSFWAQMARRGGAFVAVLFIAASVAAGWYAVKNLKVDTDTTNMLSSDLSFQEGARKLRSEFPQIRDELSVIVRAPTLDEVDAYASLLYQRLTKRTDIITEVFSPTDESFFRENGLLFLTENELEKQLTNLTKAAGLIEKLYYDPSIDTLFKTLAENDELAERSDLGGETLDRIYNDLAVTIENAIASGNDPFSWRGVLVDGELPKGGYLRIVNVTPITDFSRLKPIQPALEGMRAEIAILNQEFGGRAQALITGTLALRGEELESVTRGIGFSFLCSFFLVSMLLVLAFRSIYVSALTIVSLIVTLTLTSAYAAWAFTELNLVSVAFTVLLVGLGLDFAIHLMLHVQEYRGRGLSRRVALNSTIKEVGGAMALAAPTTSLAFFSFLPTSFDGIAQLGAVAGAGVLIAFFVSVTFLPAALEISPPPKPKPASGTVRSGFSIFDKISVPIAIVFTVIALVATILLPKARFDADPMSLRSQASESVRAFNMLFDSPDTYPYRLTKLVSNQEEAKAVAEKANELDVVRSTRALTDFVPDNQDSKLELIDFAAGSLAFVITGEPATSNSQPDGSGMRALRARLQDSVSEDSAYKTGRRRLANALTIVEDRGELELLNRIENQIFRFWPELARSLRDQFNADYIDFDTLPSALSNRYLSKSGKWRVDMLPADDVRDPQKLENYVDRVEKAFPDISGSAIHSQKAGEVIAQSMIQASLLAVVVISVILLIFVQNPFTVLLILFPLSLAAILTIATGVIFDIPFNYANVIVLPLLMGIGIDSGIHLVMRQQKVGKSTDVASVYATATPRAVLFSALTTVASFGSLMLSDHHGTASMGQLLSIAIMYTLISTLIVLPALFRIRERYQNKKALR